MKSEDFGGRLLVLHWGLKYSYLLQVQNEIWQYVLCLIEHMCVVVRLCIEILNNYRGKKGRSLVCLSFHLILKSECWRSH